MTRFIETLFQLRGRLPGSPRPSPDCPSDDDLAGFFDLVLSATDRRRIENHALVCSPCHELIASVELPERTQPRARPFEIVVHLVEAGLRLVQPLEHGLRVFREGPALGPTRSQGSADSELISIEGPGQGLDRLEIQLQPNGEVRLAVEGQGPPLQPGEISSIILEVDGAPREKRPYTGERLAFAPLGQGSFHLRLVARSPGGSPRELVGASLELRA